MKVFRTIGTAVLVSVLGAGLASAQSWQPLTNTPPAGVGTIYQLRDGRILAHNDNTSDWYALTPDTTGSYVNGTWKQVASMSSDYGPLYYGSAVLPDGRLIVEGGEYNKTNTGVWTNKGAIYDPKANTWTAITPPAGWTTIGDAQSVLLPNGVYMQANCCTTQTAHFNPTTLTWTASGSVLARRNDESGYTLLPNNLVLMVDVQQNNNCGNSLRSSELYDYTADKWTCGPQTTVQLWQQNDQELGSGVLTYNGTVFQSGGNVNATNVYSVAGNVWSSGPTPPNNLDQADGPGALEPNGKVLVMYSPGLFQAGCQFLEYDPGSNTLANTANSSQCPSDSSYVGHLMILPTGQIMSTDFGSDVEIYNPAAGVVSGVAPTILSASNVLIKGSINNVLYGKQLNGLSQNNFYGDDYQAATNYPLVQLKDVNTGIVWWAATHNDSSNGIAPNAVGFTMFDLNPNMPGGVFEMTVVTNGIKSNTVRLNVLSHGTN
jgi:hypothetical protein